MAIFADTCLASAADLASGLPVASTQAGLVERDPADGPAGPALAWNAPSRRLWSAPPTAGAGETDVGFSPAGGSRPLAVCWAVSRPGASAATLLLDLKRRFPPRSGATDTWQQAAYGGSEQWSASVAGTEGIVGVIWGIRSQPEQGVGVLYLATVGP